MKKNKPKNNDYKKREKAFCEFEKFPEWIRNELMTEHIHFNEYDIYYSEYTVVNVIKKLLRNNEKN